MRKHCLHLRLTIASISGIEVTASLRMMRCTVTLTTLRRLKPTATPSGVMPRLSLPFGSHPSCAHTPEFSPLH